jgi:hypothetical protein
MYIEDITKTEKQGQELDIIKPILLTSNGEELSNSLDIHNSPKIEPKTEKRKLLYEQGTLPVNNNKSIYGDTNATSMITTTTTITTMTMATTTTSTSSSKKSINISEQNNHDNPSNYSISIKPSPETKPQKLNLSSPVCKIDDNNTNDNKIKSTTSSSIVSLSKNGDNSSDKNPTILSEYNQTAFDEKSSVKTAKTSRTRPASTALLPSSLSSLFSPPPSFNKTQSVKAIMESNHKRGTFL